MDNYCLKVTACARGLYDVTFVPQTAEAHYVNITFNDIAIDGNPFKVQIFTVNINTKNVFNFKSKIIPLRLTFNKMCKTFKLEIQRWLI